MENEKRMRREIANSNERRRMQSINAGFQSLRNLLPRHEGEKLSKAAILQQTAEYIYALEQEKTQLLAQNSQLKRLLSHNEGGEVPPKKRKGAELILPDCPTLPEVSDDIPRSGSPELGAVSSVTDVGGLSPVSEIDEMRGQLERERRARMALEEQVQSLESQLYQSDGIRDLSHQITLQYENAEIVEQSDDLRDMVSVSLDETIDDRINSAEDIHLIQMDLPTVVEHHIEPDALSRPSSPVDMSLEEDGLSSPVHSSLLEAAIKAEPKVEVEVIPGPGPASPGEPSRLYLASTSRQNLETIVEAIRHLEGDHMFAEDQPGREQDRPLALTNKPDQRRLRVEVDYRHFHPPQSRPGVIVGKHS